MNKGNVFLKFILPVFTCFLSVAAVVIGSVAVAKAYKEPEIFGMEFCVIGNSSLYNSYSQSLYVYDSGVNNAIRGNYHDENLIKEVQDSFAKLLKDSSFSPAKSENYKTINADTVQFAWLDFEGNCTEYIDFSVIIKNDAMKLMVASGGKDYYFYSDCLPNLHRLIKDTFSKCREIGQSN